MMSWRRLLLAAAATAVVSASVLAEPIAYPPAKRLNVTDDYFGTHVADPYRWLEELDSPETRKWVAAQQQVTSNFLSKLPRREAIKKRLMKLRDFPRDGLPRKLGGRYFYTHNTGLQNQSALYVKDTLQADARLLLDPNEWSKSGTIALTLSEPSPDGRWLAYGVSSAGSDWTEFHVCSVDSAIGKRSCPGSRNEASITDHLKWIKFSSVSWTRDNRGFFYSRFPEPGKKQDATFGDLANQKIYYHRLGTPQTDDVLVHESPDYPRRGWYATVSDDGRYLLITGREGTDQRTRLYAKDLRDPNKPDPFGPMMKIVDELEANYTPVGNLGSVLFVHTDLDAERGRVIAIDLNAPGRKQWQTLVPETADLLRSVDVIGGRFMAHYMQDAKSRLEVFGLDGKLQGEVALPGIGSLTGISGEPQETEFFYNFSSFVDPSANFRGDAGTRRAQIFQALKITFDSSKYETQQVFYPSKDGTRIPMFITLRKGTKLDGSHPVLMYAYGGFNSPVTPYFSTATLAWLEQGGIHAVPNLRGGGEYGREWHLAGTKERKQNVFDDFAAAGDWLVAKGYTTHARLTISGASNGGLLVGATVNQRPDLARVALPAVGVLDMLRFQKFTIGWSWVSDYGTSDDRAGFEYLNRYSPVHTVKAGVKYPAVLILTGDHDDRVHPAHSFKYAAALQAVSAPTSYPTLLRVESDAGHGAGKPLLKDVEETADALAFALHFTASAEAGAR